MSTVGLTVLSESHVDSCSSLWDFLLESSTVCGFLHQVSYSALKHFTRSVSCIKDTYNFLLLLLTSPETLYSLDPKAFHKQLSSHITLTLMPGFILVVHAPGECRIYITYFDMIGAYNRRLRNDLVVDFLEQNLIVYGIY